MSFPQDSDWSVRGSRFLIRCAFYLVLLVLLFGFCLSQHFAGTASTCWLPTSWSPRRDMTTWPPLPTSLRSPPLVPTWTCAPQMTSPSPWMPWCTTSTLTMRRWRSPTQLSCSTATSPTAVAWCALSWLWPLETTKVTRLLLACFYLCLLCCSQDLLFFFVLLCDSWDSLNLHETIPKGLHEPHKRPSYKECASSGYASWKRKLTWRKAERKPCKSNCCTSHLPTWKCGQSEPKLFMDSGEVRTWRKCDGKWQSYILCWRMGTPLHPVFEAEDVVT